MAVRGSALRALACLGVLASAQAFTPAALADTGWVPVESYYSLPVKPQYSPFFVYELREAKWRVLDNGRLFVSYRLPQDLMGREDETMVMFTVEPIGDETFFHMYCNRTGSEAMCTRQNRSVSCAVHYTGLSIDPALVKQRIVDKYGVSAETDKRLEAASVFNLDAVGALSITAPE